MPDILVEVARTTDYLVNAVDMPFAPPWMTEIMDAALMPADNGVRPDVPRVCFICGDPFIDYPSEDQLAMDPDAQPEPARPGGAEQTTLVDGTVTGGALCVRCASFPTIGDMVVDQVGASGVPDGSTFQLVVHTPATDAAP